MKKSAKFMGPVDASQKKITNFFIKKNDGASKNTAGGQKTISDFLSSKNNPGGGQNNNNNSSSKSGRRKTSRLLKPTNTQNVEVVDLADSDGEDLYCVLSGCGTVYTKAPTTSAVKTRVPVLVQPFRPSTSTDGKPETKAGNESENLYPKCEKNEADIVLSDSDETLNQEENDETCASDADASNSGLIRLVNFKAILEDSQSSCETQLCDMNTQRIGTITPIKSTMTSQSIASSSKSSLSVARNIFASPTRVKTSAKKSSPTSATRKTPTTAKSKLNYFSPIRQLNRSKSKTPVKSPRRLFQNATPLKNQSTDSPLKALWSQSKNHEPYYIKNFMKVLESVLDDKLNAHLLNAEDLEIIEKFRGLTKPAKCLYVRLAGRQWKWLKPSSINYKEYGEDLVSYFTELHREKFVSEIKEETLPLEELLEMLPHEKLPEMCKHLHITLPRSKTKEKCIEVLVKTSKQQATLKGSRPMAEVIYSKARADLGTAYKLTAASRSLFQRIFILYSPPQYWEQSGDKDTLQLLSILLSEIGQVEYPQYKVTKTRRIYNDRNELIQFQEAWLLYSDATMYTENHQWDEVVEAASEAMNKLKSILNNEAIVESNTKLPSHLQMYVAGSLYAKIVWHGVGGMQKLKKYALANEYLQFLLQQNVYSCNSRGRYYDRLVLNSTHLKLPVAEILSLIEKALSDPNVGNNYKLDLSKKLIKLKVQERNKALKRYKRKPKRKKRTKKKKATDEFCESSSSSEPSSDSEIEIDLVEQDTETLEGDFIIRNTLPERTIEGEQMPMFDREYGKAVFLNNDGSHLSSVEKFAIQYYQKEGYTHGVHAEGAVPATIYGLLFWDVIYNDSIPDVFLSPYQAFPLDLFSTDFRINRSPLIDTRLAHLKNVWDIEKTLELMEKHWTENYKKLSVVNWDVFSDFCHIKTLVSSLGLPLIAGICDRLASNYRYYRSGFPDVIVWNGQNYRIAEVKSPRDKLSAKQRLWIDYLLSLDANVEVCHVKAVSNKRIRLA